MYTQAELDAVMMAGVIGPAPSTMRYWAMILEVGGRRYFVAGLERMSAAVLAAAEYVPADVITREPPVILDGGNRRLGYVDARGRCWWGEPGSSRAVMVYDPGQQGGHLHA